MPTRKPRVIVSILEPEESEARERELERIIQESIGRPGQPPMADRLRAVSVVVDQLERDGIPFATARNSRMNKAVREWLHQRMGNSQDARKSRRKLVSADAVTRLLKKVAELRSTST